MGDGAQPADLTLAHGRFFGPGSVRRESAGFLLDCLQPTVPERELRRHMHDEAHFVMLLAGRYITSARGGAAECAVGTLIYNPPGTTHRDRFRGLDGRFFTLSVPNSAIALCDGLGADGGARQLGHRSRRFAYALVQESERWDRHARLRRAMAMLRDPRLALADIAMRCGYADQSHFNRQFVRVFGTTPAAYRRGGAFAGAASAASS